MRKIFLSISDILSGYDLVSQLYPNIPPMSIWRAWELAAYQRYQLPEPVLDIGCGDGRFFQIAWPKVQDVVGIDIDPSIVDAARNSGAYRAVYLASAHRLPVISQIFSTAFANCSLEHMDYLAEVIRNIYRSLIQGGTFLLSVVTEKFLEWNTLPLLVNHIGESARARALQEEYKAYHHLVNPLPVEGWMNHLEKTGFEVLEYTPILPEMTSRLFLFLDHLWHVRQPSGEVGDFLSSFFMGLPNFSGSFRQVLAGLLQIERDWSVGSGAIFYARKKV